MFAKDIGRPKENDEEIYSFTLETELRNKDGQPIIVRNVLEKTITYCPVCGFADFRNNEGHNAFIDINDNHLYFIYCPMCEAHKRGVNGKGVYNLNSIDAYLLKTKELHTTVFIDRNTCQYYSVSVENGKVMVDLIRSQYFAKQFCKSKNLPIPQAFPHARLENRFDEDQVIDFEKGFVNKYIAPDVLKMSVPEGFEAKIPEYTGKLINHVFAEDQEIIDHFLNDLAYLVQTRKKLITSYLMQGTEGTGKGLFFKHVLCKIFGERYCSETSMDAFGSRFNDFLTNNFLVLVSGISINFTNGNRNEISIAGKIKMAITDQYIHIEAKGRPRQLGENNCSFLFATNKRHGLVLPNDDRRFNVAPRQETKIMNTDWWPGYDEMVELLAKELQDFVWFLKSKPVQHRLLGAVISNAPKKLLQSASSVDVEDLNRAVYVFEFSNRSAYVGLSYNIQRRYSNHVTESNSPVYSYIRTHPNIKFQFKQLSEYLPSDSAARLEIETIGNYKAKGWRMLNTSIGGGLGARKGCKANRNRYRTD